MTNNPLQDPHAHHTRPVREVYKASRPHASGATPRATSAEHRHAFALFVQAAWPWATAILIFPPLVHRALQSVLVRLDANRDAERIGSTAWELRTRILAIEAESLQAPAEASSINHAVQATWSDHPELVSIDAFAPTGRILYSTDSSVIGTPVPSGWRDAPHRWRPTTASGWLTADDGLSTYIVAMPPAAHDRPAYVSVTFALPPPAPAGMLDATGATFAGCAGILLAACFAFWLMYRPAIRFARTQMRQIRGTPASVQSREEGLSVALARVRDAEERLATAEKLLSESGIP